MASYKYNYISKGYKYTHKFKDKIQLEIHQKSLVAWTRFMCEAKSFGKRWTWPHIFSSYSLLDSTQSSPPTLSSSSSRKEKLSYFGRHLLLTPNLFNPINLQFLLLSVNWRGTFGSKYVEVWASSFYMWVFTYVRLCGRMSEIEIWEHISLSSVPIGCRLGSNISVFLPFCMILILEDNIFRMKITFHCQVCHTRCRFCWSIKVSRYLCITLFLYFWFCKIRF